MEKRSRSFDNYSSWHRRNHGEGYHFWFLLFINFILCFLISNSMLRGIPYTKANANPTAQNQAELSEFVCLGKDGSLIKTDATVSCQWGHFNFVSVFVIYYWIVWIGWDRSKALFLSTLIENNIFLNCAPFILHFSSLAVKSYTT